MYSVFGQNSSHFHSAIKLCELHSQSVEKVIKGDKSNGYKVFYFCDRHTQTSKSK